MGRLPRSAAYFVRTPEVDEFLREFARVRRWHLGGAGVAAETEEAESESVPYRRRGSKGRSAGDRANEAAVTELADDVPADDMLAAAQVMLKGSCIHLDAFISLVVAHNTLVDKIEREAAGDGPQPRRFELHEIMKNARIKDRKVPNPVEGDDLQSILRAAEEQRYQRLVADVNKKFDTNSTKVVQFKPPIIGGINTIFGVALTFVGGYSIASILGVKDIIKKAVIGIVLASAALLVDTLLFLMRCERFFRIKTRKNESFLIHH